MRTQLLSSLNNCVSVVQQLLEPASILFIEEVSALLAETFRRGNKILIAGNGGSLCDANHFAEELTGFFRGPRPALPALALSEAGHITCTGNDLGFEYIFSRGIEAYGKPGDVFIGLTTSGNSPNIVKAFEAAKNRSLKTVSFLGKGGGKLKGFADHELIIQNYPTSDRIQEAHMAAIHVIIEMVESLLYPADASQASIGKALESV